MSAAIQLFLIQLKGLDFVQRGFDLDIDQEEIALHFDHGALIDSVFFQVIFVSFFQSQIGIPNRLLFLQIRLKSLARAADIRMRYQKSQEP